MKYPYVCFEECKRFLQKSHTRTRTRAHSNMCIQSQSYVQKNVTHLVFINITISRKTADFFFFFCYIIEPFCCVVLMFIAAQRFSDHAGVFFRSEEDGEPFS